MAVRHTYEFPLSDENTIILEQAGDIIFLVGQLQLCSPRIFVVVNGKTIRYYENRDKIESNYILEKKVRKNGLESFFLKNEVEEIVVFGKENLKYFLPKIEVKKQSDENGITNNIILIDEGKQVYIKGKQTEYKVKSYQLT